MGSTGMIRNRWGVYSRRHSRSSRSCSCLTSGAGGGGTAASGMELQEQKQLNEIEAKRRTLDRPALRLSCYWQKLPQGDEGHHAASEVRGTRRWGSCCLLLVG